MFNAQQMVKNRRRNKMRTMYIVHKRHTIICFVREEDNNKKKKKVGEPSLLRIHRRRETIHARARSNQLLFSAEIVNEPFIPFADSSTSVGGAQKLARRRDLLSGDIRRCNYGRVLYSLWSYFLQ